MNVNRDRAYQVRRQWFGNFFSSLSCHTVTDVCISPEVKQVGWGIYLSANICDLCLGCQMRGPIAWTLWADSDYILQVCRCRVLVFVFQILPSWDKVCQICAKKEMMRFVSIMGLLSFSACEASMQSVCVCVCVCAHSIIDVKFHCLARGWGTWYYCQHLPNYFRDNYSPLTCHQVSLRTTGREISLNKSFVQCQCNKIIHFKKSLTLPKRKIPPWHCVLNEIHAVFL